MDDRRERLERARDRLEVAMESCSTNVLANLNGTYLATLAALASLPDVAPAVPAEGSVLDFATRRTQRRSDRDAAAEVAARPARKDVKRRA